MRTIIFPGPQASVQIVATGQVAERGKPIDVDDVVAAQLLEQGWLAEGDEPDGTTIDAIVAWVAGDALRAAAQIEAENARPNPRPKLLTALAAVTNNKSEED